MDPEINTLIADVAANIKAERLINQSGSRFCSDSETYRATPLIANPSRVRLTARDAK
jgi:hypothetical protein